MPCTPDFCNLHDYPVAPGGGWCRAVDTAYARSQNTPRLSSQNEDLAEAILRLSDILERMDEGRQPDKWPPRSSAPQPKTREVRKGGAPL